MATARANDFADTMAADQAIGQTIAQMVVNSQGVSREQPTCWRSTPRSRRPARVRPGTNFAVVASEVGQLAEESGRAAASIGVMSDQMRDSARRALVLAETESLETLQDIERSVQGAVAALHTTVDTLAGAAESARAAARSTHLANAAQREIRASCGSLTDTATELGHLLAQFRV